MIRVSVSSVIDTPADTLWQAIRDFDGMPSWHPGIASSEIEGGGPSDRIGCIRRMALGDGGGIIRERLLSLDDVGHAFSYAIVSSPMPISDYVAFVQILPVTDGGRSFICWRAEFAVAAADEAAMRQTISLGVFQAGFDALKRRFGG